MREIRKSGSEGGARQTNVSFLPLSLFRAAARFEKPGRVHRPRMTHFSAAKRRPHNPQVGIARPLASQTSAAKRRSCMKRWRRCRANGSAAASGS